MSLPIQIISLVSLLLLTILVQPAYAYLDPGAGSMLVAGVAGLLATLLFAIKGLYYKGRRFILGLFGKKVQDGPIRHSLVFYSEGRQYWNTFRPLIVELVSRGEQCVYLTSDEGDPGLLYASEYVRAQYIGQGAPRPTSI